MGIHGSRPKGKNQHFIQAAAELRAGHLSQGMELLGACTSSDANRRGSWEVGRRGKRVVLGDEGGWGKISSMYQNQDGVKDMKHLLCPRKSFKKSSYCPSLPAASNRNAKASKTRGLRGCQAGRHAPSTAPAAMAQPWLLLEGREKSFESNLR